MNMSTDYLLILISLVIGFFIIDYLRSFDLHEKESITKMVIVTIWGGIWSVVISIALYKLTHKFGFSKFDNIFGALFIIGPIEEFAKFVALLSAYFFIRNDLDEPTDGLLYMACVALGFSLIENYFYATRTPDSGYLIFIRVLISTPLHICSSIFMGLAFYVLVKFKRGVLLLLISFSYAILVHGLFDGIIFHSWLLIFLILVIKLSYHSALSLISYTTAKSPFRPKLHQFLKSIDKSSLEKGIECINCGNLDNKETTKIGKIKIQKCPDCGNFVATVNSLYYIFHHLGSDFRNLTQHYKFKSIYQTKFSTLFKGNYISDRKKIGFFKIDELEEALELFNQKLIKDTENQWWFKKGLTFGL